ncbi:MAG: hypothetical protein KTV77_05215 [Wolbachia endosymbiont of Fragariocoptes setiger]|nr:hypothetical protein [Wolbachia endosymbiont of Fragariocoptes setiger]
MKYCFIFCHGWGFDHKFFQPLIHEYFSQTSYHCLDLGYFEKENLHLPQQDDSIFIGIGHSLGFIKLISLNIKFSALIGIQAFINFLGFNSQLCKTRKLELRTIIQNFQKDPMYTLVSFYKRCKANYDFPNNFNKVKLMKDLELLNLTHRLPCIPILILGAMNDIIVPPKLIYDNFSRDNKIVIYNKGYHNLGLCEHNFVHKQITTFINEIKKEIHKE